MIGSLAAVGVLVAVQLSVTRLRSLVSPSSSGFRSLAGGLGAAYVFARLLPELGRIATVAQRAEGGVLLSLQRHSFLVALAGLLIYYVVLNRAQRGSQAHDQARHRWPFWVNVTLFVFFNLLVGYLLVHQVVPGATELWLYTAALAARYAVSEMALREQYRAMYDRRVRWLLAAALVAGWAGALVVDFGEDVVNLLTALLAGTILLTSLQQQMPASGQARLVTFVGACIGFVAVLVLLGDGWT